MHFIWFALTPCYPPLEISKVARSMPVEVYNVIIKSRNVHGNFLAECKKAATRTRRNLVAKSQQVVRRPQAACCATAPDAPSKRTTKKCTIKTYSFDLFSEVPCASHSSSDRCGLWGQQLLAGVVPQGTSEKRSKEYVLMVHFLVVRFDGASGASSGMLCYGLGRGDCGRDLQRLGTCNTVETS